MKNRRHITVVDKNFQYRSAIFAVTTSVILVNMLVIVALVFPGFLTLNPTMGWKYSIILALIELTAITTVWYSSLKASHRIADPMYALSRGLEQIGAGDLTGHVVFRRNDELHEIANTLNTNIGKLRERLRAAQQMSRELKEAVAQGKDVRELAERLDDELSQIRA